MNSSQALLYNPRKEDGEMIIVVEEDDRSISLPLKSDEGTECGYRIHETHLSNVYALVLIFIRILTRH